MNGKGVEEIIKENEEKIKKQKEKLRNYFIQEKYYNFETKEIITTPIRKFLSENEEETKSDMNIYNSNKIEFVKEYNDSSEDFGIFENSKSISKNMFINEIEQMDPFFLEESKREKAILDDCIMKKNKIDSLYYTNYNSSKNLFIQDHNNTRNIYPFKNKNSSKSIDKVIISRRNNEKNKVYNNTKLIKHKCEDELSANRNQDKIEQMRHIKRQGKNKSKSKSKSKNETKNVKIKRSRSYCNVKKEKENNKYINADLNSLYFADKQIDNANKTTKFIGKRSSSQQKCLPEKTTLKFNNRQKSLQKSNKKIQEQKPCKSKKSLKLILKYSFGLFSEKYCSSKKV